MQHKCTFGCADEHFAAEVAAGAQALCGAALREARREGREQREVLAVVDDEVGGRAHGALRAGREDEDRPHASPERVLHRHLQERLRHELHRWR